MGNESDYAEYLLLQRVSTNRLILKSLDQENNHHRSPYNQQYQQNFSYHYNLHHQGQHYQHQQFRRRHSYNSSYSRQSKSHNYNYNYNHIHSNYTDEEQNDQLKNTTVSTVSLSTEEMDPFDGCDSGDVDINVDIDIDIDIDIDAANAVA